MVVELQANRLYNSDIFQLFTEIQASVGMLAFDVSILVSHLIKNFKGIEILSLKIMRKSNSATIAT